MKFDDFKISLVQLSLTLKGIEFLPSKSLFLRSIFVSIFPSANVQQSMKNSVEYPESKVTVEHLAIKVRIGTVAGLQNCEESGKKESTSDKHPFPVSADFDGESEGCEETTFWKRMIYHLILRPILIVKLDGVTIEVEKTYLAPDPPAQVAASRENLLQTLPSAVLPPNSTLSHYRQLPTFAQDIFVDNLLHDDVREATRVTQCIEKWINHAQTKLRTKGVKSSEDEKKAPFNTERDVERGHCIEEGMYASTQSVGDKLKNANTTVRESQAEDRPEVVPKADARTYDERLNELICSFGRLFCHSLSIRVTNVSVIITGAGSKLVKDMRTKYNPRETNIIFARLPTNCRDQTILAADTLSFTFSPDSQCNLVICCVGLNLKVGESLNAANYLSTKVWKTWDSKKNRLPKVEEIVDVMKNQHLNESTRNVRSPFPNEDTPFSWHTITHPFHVVAEIVGVLDFFVWALNYDHEWEKKDIGVNVSATEVAVVLSPQHIHTVLLHLDDFTDTQSPFNEWIAWLASSLRETKNINDDEMLIYCSNYARINGGNINNSNGQELTASEMVEMEERMTRYEIVSLRCKAMKKVWRIPKENKEFRSFLLCSRSKVLDGDDGSNASPQDSISPFNRFYSSPLDALSSLVRYKTALLAPPLNVKFQAKTLLIDFPVTNGNNRNERSEAIPPIPTSMAVCGVSSALRLTNPIFSGKPGLEKKSRRVLQVSLNIEEAEWDIAGTISNFPFLPALRDGTLVGIIYKVILMMCLRTTTVFILPNRFHTPHLFHFQHRREGTRGSLLSTRFNVSVAPSEAMSPQLAFDAKTSDLVMVVNPLPLLSTIATILDLSDLPFRTVNEPGSLPINQTENSSDDDAASVTENLADTRIDLSTQTVVTIDNMSIIFMLDRTKVRRGILELILNSIQMKTETNGTSGDIVILPDSIVLRAGQIRHHQPNLEYGTLEWNVLPFKPMIIVDGARLCASAKEIHSKDKESTSLSNYVTKLGVDVKVGAERLDLNGSPSTIVALLSTIESLDPLWGGSSESRKAAEEERIKIEQQKQLQEEQTKLQYQRDALLRIFNSVDVDGSGSLQEEELQKVVRTLFDQGRLGSNDKLDAGQQPTSEEIERERDRLISFIDPSRSNDVSFPEVDAFLFRIANNINDNNLIPKIEVTGVNYLGNFSDSDTFLSSFALRKLVYFDDLREYAAMHEVYRLTGHSALSNHSSFPAPSLWRQSQGIEMFWELYTRETGCSRDSLNDHDIFAVQRKLVRVLW